MTQHFSRFPGSRKCAAQWSSDSSSPSCPTTFFAGNLQTKCRRWSTQSSVFSGKSCREPANLCWTWESAHLDLDIANREEFWIEKAAAFASIWCHCCCSRCFAAEGWRWNGKTVKLCQHSCELFCGLKNKNCGWEMENFDQIRWQRQVLKQLKPSLKIYY